MSHRLDASPCQTDAVPFQPKPREPDVEEAIQAVVRVNGELRAHDAGRRGIVEARAAAIQTALDKGATLAELAKLLEVSHQRIRQMAKGE